MCSIPRYDKHCRNRFGLPLDAREARVCPGCSAAIDGAGDHALCCPNLGVYARHNDLRNQVAFLCSELGLKVELEKGPTGSTARPADLLVYGLSDGSPAAVDFSVVHALQLSATLADVQPGKLAKATERRKVQENRALCRSQGWECVPFVVEVLGAWGGKARYFTQQLIRLWAVKKGCTAKEAAGECRSRIGMAILRSTARQLERAFPDGESAAAVGTLDLVYF